MSLYTSEHAQPGDATVIVGRGQATAPRIVPEYATASSPPVFNAFDAYAEALWAPSTAERNYRLAAIRAEQHERYSARKYRGAHRAPGPLARFARSLGWAF